MARLAFFGTPDFAVPSLEAVLEHAARHGDDVVLVVCQPDRPKGRGKKMQPPPVKERAEQAGLRVLQPTTLKQGTPDGDAFWEEISSLDLDLGVVAAYGRIIPGRVLRAPTRGFVNVHGSLLPRWRGAAPVQRAIEAGDAETGVCLMDMVYALDAGDVYVEGRLPILDDDDSETLSAKVAQLGHDLLVEHLPALLAGRLAKTPQPDEGVTYAEMLKKEEGQVDFNRPAPSVRDHARAMHPWPAAFTTLDGEVVKLFAPTLAEGSGEPGTVLRAGPDLVVACRDGAVAFADIQAPGKRRMPVGAFLKGHPIATGHRLGR